MSKNPEDSLVIAAFEGKETAEYVYNVLLDMEKAEMVSLKVTSTVTRNNRGKLTVDHKHGLSTWKGATGGIALGFLLGGPILGGAIGALIGSRGKGEQRKAKKFLDDKLGDDDSALILVLKDADYVAVRDMLLRYGGKPMQLELSEEAQKELARVSADSEVANAVREEIDIVEESGDESDG